MRRAFEETLYQLAAQDERVIFLTGDLGYQVFDRFQRKFGRRYVNVGVAEAQLVNAAAGLAAEGWRPVAYSIAAFATARPYEQIKISVCYPHLPVIIVGAGGGFTYASSGVTHHAADDLALMCTLPGMSVVAPGCPDELRQLMPQMVSAARPFYLRIGKFGEKDYKGATEATLGQARRIRDGQRIALISTGDIASEVLEAVTALEAEGIVPLFYQFHTVKPLDLEAIEELSRRVAAIVVVEEHGLYGGLFSGLCHIKAMHNYDFKLYRLGAPDEFILGNPSRREIRSRLGVDAKAVRQTCREAWNDAAGDETKRICLPKDAR
ncbi:MAG: hypothetical protein JSW39_00155 [Desulfobacterales bacterium]|nr:MAG: hypothetical protein JSW39_00155 [Desulfobacterales bacterium]